MLIFGPFTKAFDWLAGYTKLGSMFFGYAAHKQIFQIDY